METNTERYEGFEQIFDGVQECPVDTEYTLPDYCADIQKILKCIVTPEVTSVSAAGDSLTIDGCASMHVLYLDAKGGCVRGEITSVQYVITDSSTVECTAELRMEEQVRVVYAARSLESAELDETTEPEPCCAAVYYASSGEKVWDIAKRYHARVSAIRTHNDCMEDVLSEDRPVIICRK